MELVEAVVVVSRLGPRDAAVAGVEEVDGDAEDAEVAAEAVTCAKIAAFRASTLSFAC